MTAPVVLVHGLRATAAMWATEYSVLTEQGVRVATPDLPGFGSRHDEGFSRAGAVRAIADAVAAFDEPVLLAGFALGGLLAVHYAGDAGPGRLAGVVAIGCGTQPLHWFGDSYRQASFAAPLLREGLGEMERFANRAFIRGADGGRGAESAAAVLGELAALDVRGSLSRIRTPVWLVNGRRDRYRLQEPGFLRACRDGRLVRVPGGSDADGPTRPDEVALALGRIVGEVSRES